MEIKGKIVSGTHKGSYFMSLEVYKDEFQEKLGFLPFPGTLNLEVSKQDAEAIFDLDDKMGIIKGQGSFGDVKFLMAELITAKSNASKINGAILFPMKTQHSNNILEFVAEVNLRKSLQLKDGDNYILEIP